jgi:hypothetical protein
LEEDAKTLSIYPRRILQIVYDNDASKSHTRTYTFDVPFEIIDFLD